MKGFTRRQFLKAAGVSAGTTLLSGAGMGGTAQGAPPTFTGVTYLTPAYENSFPIIMGFVNELKKHPDLFKIDFFDSGTLIKADEQTAALRAGTIHFMFHTTSYITRTFPVLGITGLPSLCGELAVHGERLDMESPLWKQINDVLAKDNTFMLTAGGGVEQPEYIWSGANKVSSLADLKGKRVRIVSYEAEEVLKAYGVAGARIPSSELYLAVQRGTVEATVANISTVMARKLYEQVKNCYQLPVTAFAIAVFFMKDRWDKLPDKTKAAFWDAGKWFDKNYAMYLNKKFYPEKYWPRIEQAGVKIFKPTENEFKDFEVKSQPVWAWWKKQVGEEVGQRAINFALGRK
jgi:TRAP-type C4-dicarboxylate transport system substrate-binding protein